MVALWRRRHRNVALDHRWWSWRRSVVLRGRCVLLLLLLWLLLLLGRLFSEIEGCDGEMELSLLCATQSEPQFELLTACQVADRELHMPHVIIRIRSKVPITQFDHDHIRCGIEDIESELLVPVRIQIVLHDFGLE